VQARNAAQTEDQLRFDLHVGIDYGEALILDNGDLRANAANQAARAGSVAPAGEVYFTAKVALELQDHTAAVSEIGPFDFKGIGLATLHRLEEWRGPLPEFRNPFAWRGGITKAEDFFVREKEQSRLCALLKNRANCQIVGPRRIGKTSFLRHLENQAPAWLTRAAVAYLDLQDPRCYMLEGLLKHAGQQWGWETPANDLIEFSERLDAMLDDGLRPVLLLDEFKELTRHEKAFTREFFLTLRAKGQRGVSIVTTSNKPLYELTDPNDDTSPFFNTFPLQRLGLFAEPDARAFLRHWRPGVPSFSQEEQNEIVIFAKGQPLALQVACDYLLQAKQRRESLVSALRQAEDEIKAMMPKGW
jgi:hypothetical protein